MPRMPYPDLDQLAPAARARLQERLPLNIYRMLCHAPTFFPGWMDLGRAVLYEAKLDPRLRELAIMRVAHLSGSAYEAHQHRKIALAVGLSTAQIEGTRQAPDESLYDERERIALRMTEQLVRQVKTDDALFAQSVQRLGQQETMELMISVGFYMMVARVIENTGIEIEPGGGPSQDEVRKSRAEALARVGRPVGGAA